MLKIQKGILKQKTSKSSKGIKKGPMPEKTKQKISKSLKKLSN